MPLNIFLKDISPNAVDASLDCSLVSYCSNWESQSQFQVRTLEKGALIAQWCGNSPDAPSLEVGRNSSGKARHGRSNSGLLFVQHL